MKFQLIVRVCLIFYMPDSANFQKASGITPWKKCYSLLRCGPAYYRMCSTDVYCSKQTGSSSTKGNHHHHFFVSGVGRRKLSCSHVVAAQKMLLKRNPANIRKWIARFYYFRHLYSAGSACVLLTIIAWVAHRYGQLYLHCSLIYFWVPSSCFCIVIQPLWCDNPVQRCLPVGGRLRYPRRRRW